METKNKITVQTTVQADIRKVWEFWTRPEHIVNWNFASDDWCCPSATNDLRPNGAFNWRMESKDGKMGFDFTGTYDKISDGKLISYTMSDGRTVHIRFEPKGDGVDLSETFEAEETNSLELQRTGWQAILGNFKRYVEADQ